MLYSAMWRYQRHTAFSKARAMYSTATNGHCRSGHDQRRQTTSRGVSYVSMIG